MKKKSVVECMIPFIDRMRGYPEEESKKEPLTITDVKRVILHDSEEMGLRFVALGTGITQELDDADMVAEMWSVSEESGDELIGFLPLTFEAETEFGDALVTDGLYGKDYSTYQWARMAKIHIGGEEGEIIANLDIDLMK